MISRPFWRTSRGEIKREERKREKWKKKKEKEGEKDERDKKRGIVEKKKWDGFQIEHVEDFKIDGTIYTPGEVCCSWIVWKSSVVASSLISPLNHCSGMLLSQIRILAIIH